MWQTDRILLAINKKKSFTLKNCSVEPPFSVPYLISVCLLRSSAFSIGVFKRETVRKAARFAV